MLGTILLGVLLELASSATPWGSDLAGQPVRQLAPAHTRAILLFFTATDCPIANRYIPEIARLAQPGVALWFVYPNPGDTTQAVQAHRARYAIPGSALLDTSQTLTDLAHATVTPEAAILVADGEKLRVLYRGRIDDRYAGLGQERPQATHHDLKDALAAVLDGRPVPRPGGPPVGCAIVPREPHRTASQR